MTRIDWAGVGQRFFETGIDRGVLYIEDSPGVPWLGLVNVSHNQSGGQPKPRYLDGIKISNRTSPEELQGSIEAFTHPIEFERCDGTAQVGNGLRVRHQRRRSFGMVYRSKIGNDTDGLDFAYKIHILYNLKAEPSDRRFQTLSDQAQPSTLNWKISSRAPRVEGYHPSSHYIVDSRDTPLELLTQLEDILYGTSEDDPTLPSPGELVFLFDAFEDLVYDAGSPFTPAFATYDAGTPDDTYDNTIDGGAL